MRKKIIRWGFLVFGVLLVLVCVVLWRVGAGVTVERVVSEMESRWNMRVEVERVEASMVGLAMGVELEGLKIAPRDGVADAGTAPGEREALGEDGVLVSVGVGEVRIRWWDLLRGRMRVDVLGLEDVLVRQVIRGDGSSVLEDLVLPPEVVDGEANADYERLMKLKVARQGRQFTAFDLPGRVEVGELSLVNGRVVLAHEGTGLRVEVDEVQALIEDVDVDPETLDGINRLEFDGEFRSRLFGAKQAEALVDLRVAGRGEVWPFQEGTGLVKPATRMEVTFFSGSSLEGLPLVRAMTGALDPLEKIGVPMDKVKVRAVLVEDARTRVSLAEDVFVFEEGWELEVENYLVAADAGSWFDWGTGKHSFKGRLGADIDLSRMIVGGAAKWLEKEGGVRGFLGDFAKKNLLGDDDRFEIGFSSEEDLSAPVIAIKTPFGAVGDGVQKWMQKGIRGLLD